jgi:hypothetical protein
LSGHPAVAPQEHVGPEGTTRAASPEIQEAEEGLGAVLSQGAASSEAVDGRKSLFSTLNLEQISLHQILHYSCRVIN